MANFLINTGGTSEWEDWSGGSVNATLDTYTISNRTTFRIAVDTYQCQNHSAAFGSFDGCSFGGSGGKVRLDGTQVRVLPFNTGSGTVPAIGTTISQGGVSGPLLGIWADWQSEPLAAGAAMPATGYIKLKSVTGGAFASGALTGISASATGPDVVGWIEVRAPDTSAFIVSRLGVFETEGDWFELGTTNGSRGQILQCPTTGTVAGIFPGVWIETGAGTGVYERWPCVGTMPASASTPTDVRARFVWQTTAGIRIGSDGTNNVGLLPPTGCRVRIPNIIMTCCTRTVGSGSGPRVLPNATLSTRAEFSTGTAGIVSLKNCVVQWYAVFWQCKSLTLGDIAIAGILEPSECATPMVAYNGIVAPVQQQAVVPLTLTSSFYGGDFDDWAFVRSAFGTGNVVNLASVQNANFRRCRSQALVERTSAGATTWNVSGASGNILFDDCDAIGAKVNVGVSAFNCKAENLHYCDRVEGTTTSANAGDMLTLSGTLDFTLDGYDFMGLTNVHPYNSVVQMTNTIRTRIRNAGSPTARLSLGSANSTARIILSGGGNRDFRIQRLYHQDTRTDQWSMSNFDIGGVIEHVWGDALDSSTVAANECKVRACLGLNSTANLGATYGQHWQFYITSAISGRLSILGNEPLDSTADQCFISAGTPQFDGQSEIKLTSVGDEITWVTPYWVKGASAFAASGDPVLAGTTTGNLAYEFQIDTGSGWNGTWLTLNSTNLTSFNAALVPAQGFKIKIRARCVTASNGNSLRSVRITFDIPTGFWEDLDNLYPLETLTVSLSNVVVGSAYRLERVSDGTEIVSGTAASSAFDLTVDGALLGVAARLKVRKASGSPYYQPYETQIPSLASTQSIFVSQIADE